VDLLLSGAGALVTQDVQNANMLKAIFISAFTNETGFQKSQTPGGKTGARKTYLWWKRIRSGHTQANWTCVSLWALMGGTHDCQGR